MLKRNIIANFLGKIWPSLLGLLLVPVYLKYLGVEAYGLIGFFVSLQGLIGFLDMGLSTASVREVARSNNDLNAADSVRDLVHTFEVIYWGVAFLIAMGFVLSSNWLAEDWITSNSIPSSIIRLAAVIFGCTLALRWPVALYSGVMRGLEKQVIVNLLSAAIVTFRNVGAALMVMFVSQSIVIFLLWQLGSALIEVLVMMTVTWRLMPFRVGYKSGFHFEVIKKVGRFSVSLTIISVLASIFKQFDRIAITKLLSLEAVGYYTAAYALYDLLSYFVSPIVDASFPRISSLVSLGKVDELKRIYHHTAQVISFFIAPASAFVFLFSYQILFFWSRSTNVAQNAYQTLSILALAYSFNAMMHIPLMLQYAYGITSIAVGVNIVGTVFLLPLMYFMIRTFGIVGTGVGWLVYNLLYYSIVPHIMHRRILKGEKKTWILKDTLFFIFLAWILMCGAFMLPSEVDNNLSRFVAVCISMAIYTVISLIFFPSIRALIPNHIMEKLNSYKRKDDQ